MLIKGCVVNSRARPDRKEETPLSDLDLAYLLEEGLAPSAEAEADKELYIGLSRLLGTDEITLVSLARAPLSIIFSAIQEGKVLRLTLYPGSLEARWRIWPGSGTF